MNKDEYFVILGSEDGEPTIRKLTKEQIAKMMIPNQWGDYEYGEREFLADIPEVFDPCNFSDIVIIKGKIIVPKPKQVVTEYEVE